MCSSRTNFELKLNCIHRKRKYIFGMGGNELQCVTTDAVNQNKDSPIVQIKFAADYEDRESMITLALKTVLE